MESTELIETFKHFVASGMRYAIKSHDVLFKKECDISVPLAYLNAAISRFSSAEAFYYAQYDSLQDDCADKLFFLFDKFANELFNNVASNHSHQWTDIEYECLNDLYLSSAFSSDE